MSAFASDAEIDKVLADMDREDKLMLEHNPISDFFTDFRCPACNRVLQGSEDVRSVRRKPCCKQCKHCKTEVTLVHEYQKDLGITLWSFERKQG